jgi:hypothetical protein
MFDFLESFSADQLIPAGYNAIQFIRRSARASVAAGEYASFEALPPKQVELAKRIVAEIEAREGQPVVVIHSQDRRIYYDHWPQAPRAFADGFPR